MLPSYLENYFIFALPTKHPHALARVHRPWLRRSESMHVPNHPIEKEASDAIEIMRRPISDVQSEASSASAASWCAGPPAPRSRYIDAPTPAKQGSAGENPQPGRGANKSVFWLLKEAPRFVVAGAVVAAVATGFIKVRTNTGELLNCTENAICINA